MAVFGGVAMLTAMDGSLPDGTAPKRPSLAGEGGRPCRRRRTRCEVPETRVLVDERSRLSLAGRARRRAARARVDAVVVAELRQEARGDLGLDGESGGAPSSVFRSGRIPDEMRGQRDRAARDTVETRNGRSVSRATAVVVIGSVGRASIPLLARRGRSHIGVGFPRISARDGNRQLPRRGRSHGGGPWSRTLPGLGRTGEAGCGLAGTPTFSSTPPSYLRPGPSRCRMHRSVLQTFSPAVEHDQIDSRGCFRATSQESESSPT